MLHALQQPHEGVVHHSLNHVVIGGEDLQEGCEVRRVPFLRQIGFTNADVALADQALGKGKVMHDQLGIRAGGLATRQETAAIR